MCLRSLGHDELWKHWVCKSALLGFTYLNQYLTDLLTTTHFSSSLYRGGHLITKVGWHKNKLLLDWQLQLKSWLFKVTVYILQENSLDVPDLAKGDAELYKVHRGAIILHSFDTFLYHDNHPAGFMCLSSQNCHSSVNTEAQHTQWHLRQSDALIIQHQSLSLSIILIASPQRLCKTVSTLSRCSRRPLAFEF